MNRKRTALFLSLPLLLLSGCRAEKTAVPAAPPQPAEPVKLVLVSDGGQTEADAVLPLLQKKFPAYTFEYINADEEKKGGKGALLTAGQQMDIAFESMGSFSNAVLRYDLQYDMKELTAKHRIDLSRFTPSMLDVMRQMSGGALIGLPVSYSAIVLYYNKDLFDKFGVPYPKDGMTWDETIQLAKQLTRSENGKQFYGLTFSENNMLAQNQLSLGYVDPATSKPTIAANEQWRSWLLNAYVPIKDLPNLADARKLAKSTPDLPDDKEFLAGDVAMFIANFDQDKWQKAAFNWDIAAAPTLKDKPGVGFQPYPTYYSVLKVSERKDEAMATIGYLTSDEFQEERAKQGVIPAVNTVGPKQALKQTLGANGKRAEAVLSANPAPLAVKTGYDKGVEKIYRNVLRTVLFNGVDINTALRQAEEQAAQEIAKTKK